MRILLSALLASALSFSAQIGSAATVENGSFEDIGDGTLNSSGWRQFSSVPGWEGLPNVEIQSGPTLSQIDAQDGERYAELDTNTNAGMVQQIDFVAGVFELSFYYSPRVNNSPTTTNDMYYAIFAGEYVSPAQSVLYGEVNDAPNVDYPYGEWTKITGIFEIEEAGTYSLLFHAAGEQNTSGCGDCGALIDNVSISAVPLPASALFLLAGIGGLASMRRRKHS